MTILSIIFPVLAVAMAGYATLALRWFDRKDTDALSRVTFDILIPSLLFVSTARSEVNLGESGQFLAAYYGSVLVIYVLGLLVGRIYFHYAAKEQSVFAMGCAYSNTTILGIPLVAQALGEEALLPLFLIISIQNLVMFMVGTVAAEYGHLSTESVIKVFTRMAKQLLSSPITASLIAGLLCNIANIPVWDPLFNSIEILSRAAVPTSLFVLGMSLYHYNLRQQVVAASIMTVINTALLPILVWIAMFRVFEVDPLWANTGVLASAMPVGISAYVFANRYKTGHAAVAAGSLLSAVLAPLTLTVVLLLLGIA